MISSIVPTVYMVVNLILSLFVPKSCKPIALTFDDGPQYPFTPTVLQILKQRHVPATFFLIGEHVEKYPELVKQIIHDGNEIGNHTYDHPDLATLSKDQLWREIEMTNNAIEKVTNNKNVLFRPPYGSQNKYLKEAEAAFHLQEIDWSIDPVNWSDPKPLVSIDAIMSQAAPKSIVLLHDGIEDHPKIDHDLMDGVDKLPEIITRLRSKGYCFSTVSNLNTADVCRKCQ